jgi:predicted transcriptional regulator
MTTKFTTQMLIRIQPEMKRALIEMAEDEKRPVSSICREALAEKLERYYDEDEL